MGIGGDCLNWNLYDCGITLIARVWLALMADQTVTLILTRI